MLLSEIEAVIDEISLPGTLYLRLRAEGRHAAYLQVRDGSLAAELEGGRKWRLSYWMTRSEVVQTAFKAYLAWLEHEARESFLYRDAAIFGPHFDVDILVGIHRGEHFDVRQELVS